MTSEEVFALFERNQEEINQIVQPVCIGDSSISCRFSVKCYIRPGEECPVCLEKILLKKDSYLTDCGHAFHRQCLFQVLENKWKEKLFGILNCPLCRCKLGFPEFSERYCFRDNPCYLDILENFWLTKDFMLPHYCTNTIKSIHYLGMNRKCRMCKDYRENG